MSALDTLDAAQENLCIREGTERKQIHAVDVNDEALATSSIATVIRSWLRTQRNLEAAVWTGLGSNWETMRRSPFSPDDAIQYIAELKREQEQATLRYDRAREYIENAPEQIQTRVRTMLRENGYKDAILPTILFEAKASENP